MKIVSPEMAAGLPAVMQLRHQFDADGFLVIKEFKRDLSGFEEFTRQFCQGFHDVAIRQSLRLSEGDGYSTGVFQENFTLFSHAEAAYRPYPRPPDVCFFHCLTAPLGEGGETTVLDGRTVAEVLKPTLYRRFDEEGVIYECHWDRQRWQDEFGVKCRKELVTLLQGFTEIKFSVEQEQLHFFYRTSPFQQTRQGLTVFTNGLLAHLPRVNHPRYQQLRPYYNPANRVYWGNGEPIADEVINDLLDIQEAHQYRHRWSDGDLLVLDNTRYMHGRTKCIPDCERRIVSRFGYL